MSDTELVYQMPFSHIVKGLDLKPLVVTLDGDLIPLDDWKSMRVTKEEYFALMRRRMSLPEEPEYQEEPDYEEEP